MKLINMTPHPININGFTVPPCGTVARVSEVISEIAPINIGGVEIALETATFGDVVGLPETKVGVLIIVSAMVKAACGGRRDLVSPAKLVRNDAGMVVGCQSLRF